MTWGGMKKQLTLKSVDSCSLGSQILRDSLLYFFIDVFICLFIADTITHVPHFSLPFYPSPLSPHRPSGYHHIIAFVHGL